MLDIAPEFHGDVKYPDVNVDTTSKGDVEDDILEEDTDADLYVVRSLDAEASPDKLRTMLE